MFTCSREKWRSSGRSSIVKSFDRNILLYWEPYSLLHRWMNVSFNLKRCELWFLCISLEYLWSRCRWLPTRWHYPPLKRRKELKFYCYHDHPYTTVTERCADVESIEWTATDITCSIFTIISPRKFSEGIYLPSDLLPSQECSPRNIHLATRSDNPCKPYSTPTHRCQGLVRKRIPRC